MVTFKSFWGTVTSLRRPCDVIGTCEKFSSVNLPVSVEKKKMLAVAFLQHVLLYLSNFASSRNVRSTYLKSDTAIQPLNLEKVSF